MPLERYQRYHEEKARGGIALTMFGGSSMVSPDSSSWGGGQVNVSDRRDHPASAAVLGPHPRAWGGDHVPDQPSRPPGHLGRHQLAANAGPVRDPRDPASRRAAGDGPRRHRPHRPRLCRGRLPLQGGRAGRDRDGDRRPPDRAVPVAAHQPAHRRLRRLGREPGPLRHHGARGHPPPGRRRFPGRHPLRGRRGHRGRHRLRRVRAPGAADGGGGHARFLQRHLRPHGHRPRACPSTTCPACRSR